MLDSGHDEPRSRAASWFASTNWTAVLNARLDDSAEANRALEELCRVYWTPLNGYIRGRGYSPADAEDLTQQFFEVFLKKRQHSAADPTRGRFRSFLLTCLKNFLTKEHERKQALKRGGGARACSLDEQAEGGGPVIELSDERSADWIFEREWAMSLLSRARERLRTEYASNGKEDRFQHLERFLPGEDTSATYFQIATLLGVPEGTLKSDVHRFKRRYAELVREEIASTVGNADEIEDEVRYLRTVLARGG